MNTPLEKLRQKYESEIKQAEDRLVTLRTKLSLIDELAAEAGTGRPRSPEQTVFSSGSVGLTEAVERIVASVTGGLTAKEVKSELENLRFPSRGPNFGVSVHTTLRRLSDKDRIRCVMEPGKVKRYFPKTF